MNKAYEARDFFLRFGDLNRKLKKEYGVTMRQVTLLVTVHNTPGIAMTRAAALLGLASATITQLVDHCEARDLIRRTKHPTDRRIYCLELTETATKLLDVLAEEKVPV